MIVSNEFLQTKFFWRGFLANISQCRNIPVHSAGHMTDGADGVTYEICKYRPQSITITGAAIARHVICYNQAWVGVVLY